MIDYSKEVKKQRKLYGISQSKLSENSRVSLPMIQLIEAGKANPSLEVMEKLNRSLGLTFSISITYGKTEQLLTHFGLIQKQAGMRSVNVDKKNFSLWISDCQNESLIEDPRWVDAFSGILLCLIEYFPTFAKKMRLNLKEIVVDGRTIKFKRMVLPKLIEIFNS